MAEGSSVFDMIGPVMIGPSSSHTAGVVRIARTARKLFGRQPEETVITFYNSFEKSLYHCNMLLKKDSTNPVALHNLAINFINTEQKDKVNKQILRRGWRIWGKT